MEEMRGAAAWNLTCGGPVTSGCGANLCQKSTYCHPTQQQDIYVLPSQTTIKQICTAIPNNNKTSMYCHPRDNCQPCWQLEHVHHMGRIMKCCSSLASCSIKHFMLSIMHTHMTPSTWHAALLQHSMQHSFEHDVRESFNMVCITPPQDSPYANAA